MNIFIIKNNTKIATMEDWYKYAPPKDKTKQWKEGRSAIELARFALTPSFNEFIKMIIKEVKVDERVFVCEPEATTSFGKGWGRGGPRNHDLLMVGENVLIGLEAKVSESFGENTVKKEWEKANNPNKREKRIQGLIRFLSNGVYNDYDSTPDPIKELQYQLLTSTVGTILEAKRKEKKEAVVLVLVFKGNVAKEDNYNKKCNNNDMAFDAFKNAFFVNNPMVIQGVNCRIMKKDVEIKSNYCFG